MLHIFFRQFVNNFTTCYSILYIQRYIMCIYIYSHINNKRKPGSLSTYYDFGDLWLQDT